MRNSFVTNIQKYNAKVVCILFVCVCVRACVEDFQKKQKEKKIAGV